MASPPKPWERAGGGAVSTTATAATPTSATLPSPSTSASSSPLSSSSTTTALGAASSSASTTAPPPLPAMPAGLSSTVNQNAAAYSRLGTSPYGYGGGAYGTAYSSPYGGTMYSRFGGYGGGMYGAGMYGAGGMYGGGMYGAGGGMYGGGMPGGPNDPNSLTNRFNNSTQATFQMLEGVVGAFGGFAQMLESTYMATHSSFFAMVSVAEQFGNLRDTLGSVLGIFTLMRWLRTLIAKLTGRPPPADAMSLTPAAFARFEGRAAAAGAGSAGRVGPDGHPRPSRKPLLFFILAAFGLPYLMGKVIRSLATSQQQEEDEQRRRMALQQQGGSAPQLDPSQLEFCRVLYDYSPPNNNSGEAGLDLSVKAGDFVAVLSRSDPIGNPSDWWRCRSRDARVGYLPSNYLEIVPRKSGAAAVTTGAVKAIKNTPASESSRANSLTSTVSAPATMAAALNPGAGAASSSSSPPPPPVPESKVGDISAESFQKSQFYS